jgi:hypothetical protein
MSHVDFSIKQDDRRPYLKGVLKDQDDNIYDPTGAVSILFRMEARDASTLKVDNQAVNIVDGPNGIVEYQWATGDTDTPGIYFGEIVVTPTAGVPFTFPNDGYIIIEVKEKVA